MKRLLISPYFGKLPNYFQLFLDSCALNDDFCDFLIITDDQTKFILPGNVKIVSMSFGKFNDLVVGELGAEYSISSPYKICDYRPAFGRILKRYIQGYDFWGHVDTDLLLGKLSNFLPESVFHSSDRLLERGALMFYANKKDINNLFNREVPGIINFREAVKVNEPCFYDEIMFPALLSANGYKTYSDTRYADILPQSFAFVIDSHCELKNAKSQYFVYRAGKGLYQLVDAVEVECMYLHVQKRPMLLNIDKYKIPANVYIQENTFSAEFQTRTISKLNSLAWSVAYFRRQLRKLDGLHLRIYLRARLVRKRIEW